MKKGGSRSGQWHRVAFATLVLVGFAVGELRGADAPVCESEWFLYDPVADCIELMVREGELAVLVRQAAGGEAEVVAELAAVGAPEFGVDRVGSELFCIPNASAAPALLVVLERRFEGRPIFDVVTDAAERSPDRYWTPLMEAVGEDDFSMWGGDFETPHQRVIVGFYDGTPPETVAKVVQELVPGASQRRIPGSQERYFVTPGLRSGYDVLALANRFFLEEEVSFAYPQPLFVRTEASTGFGGGGGVEEPLQRVPVGWPGLAPLVLILGALGWWMLGR